MKNLIKTRTNNLFNELGVLHACGDYSGYYQNEAYALLGLDNEFENTEWCDIMSDSKGNQYAIHAEGDLTLDGFCEYRKLDEDEKVKDFGTDFLDDISKTKSEIIEFAKSSNDYAILNGAGFTAINNEKDKAGIAELLEKADNYKLLSKEEVEDNASELLSEVENGCEVYEFIKSNAWQLYIAVY